MEFVCSVCVLSLISVLQFTPTRQIFLSFEGHCNVSWPYTLDGFLVQPTALLLPTLDGILHTRSAKHPRVLG